MVDIVDTAGYIAVFHISVSTCKEQAAVRTNTAGIAVGHVHQIIAATNGYDVPHMRAAGSAAGHHACNCITGHVAAEATQIAQVLERLGIALADNIGGRVTVKNRDQLPRIDVCAEIAAHGCVVVILHQCADCIPVTDQLLIIGCGSIGIHNILCLGNGLRRRSGFGCICSELVTGAVIIRNRKFQNDLRQRLAGDITRSTAGRLFIPVKFKGQVRKQSIHHMSQLFSCKAVARERNLGIHRITGHCLSGTDNCRCSLAAGNLLDMRYQRIIQKLLITGQGLTRSDSEE